MTSPAQRYVEALRRAEASLLVDDLDPDTHPKHYAGLPRRTKDIYLIRALAEALERAEPVNRPDFPNVLVIELPEEPTTR